MPTLMMNPERLRASLRRLFSNDWHEILGELLQNAQRAGATAVAITTTAGGFQIRDNGHGLREGLPGLTDLLSLGESAFQNPAVADQHPMGLGIHALLAAEGVVTVRFSSGQYAVTLDTERWWSDAAYIEGWTTQVTELNPPLVGFQIDATCTPAVVQTMIRQLRRASASVAQGWAPQAGYADLLTVTFDGVPLPAATPPWAMPHPIVETTYQGCHLTIGVSNDSRPLGVVNWYGQLIVQPTPIPFYLQVRAGRPVNPLAPTRRGLIADAALAALEQFVADTLFRTLAARPPEEIAPDWIALAWRADRDRARHLSVCVVAPLCGLDVNDAIQSAEALRAYGRPQVVSVTAAPLVVADVVHVLRATPPAAAVPDPPPAWDALDYGLDSFVPLLKAAGQSPHTVLFGTPDGLPCRTIWWCPGPNRADALNERGWWSLSDADQLPTAWQPVTMDVWAFPWTSTSDASEIPWVVGTTNPLAFLSSHVWAGFEATYDSERSLDEQEASYHESVSCWKRTIVGDCVSWCFTPDDLQQLMPDRAAPLRCLTFQYTPGVASPTGIVVENTAGQQKTLRFLD